MDELEEKRMDFIRRGDKAKANWIASMHKVILPSQIKKIQQNDKSVLREMVLPKWVSWDLLYKWAQNKKVAEGRRCIFCDSFEEVGIDFKEKFICDVCFLKLKSLD